MFSLVKNYTSPFTEPSQEAILLYISPLPSVTFLFYFLPILVSPLQILILGLGKYLEKKQKLR